MWKWTGNGRPSFAIEPSEGQESVWDYPRPPRIERDGRKVVVKEDNVEETLPSKLSAMPEGLLNTLTLQEVTDLMTFLNSPPESRTATRPQR